MLVGTDTHDLGHSVGKIPRQLHPRQPGPDPTELPIVARAM